MNPRKFFLLIVTACLVAFGISACGSDSSSDSSSASGGGATLSGDIAGAGSSAQDAAQQAWIAGFQEANSGVTIAYDPVGSGGGREAFIAGGKTVFAGSDSAFADQELTDAQDRCSQSDGELVQVPVYISPIAIIYNLEGVDSLQLSPDTLAGIFKQEITTWNDPVIAADNPDAELPDTAITPVNRSDDSGTTNNFTDYLEQTAPDVWTFPADDAFPVKGGEAAEGTSGVVAAVTGGDGTIGYADASQAGDLGIASIKIGDEYVAPSAEAASASVDESKETVEGKYVFSYAINRTTTNTSAYPLVLVSYESACTAYDNSTDGPIVKGYLDYVISAEGQDAAASNAGSAPISEKLRGQIQPAVDAIG
ncbi:MAG: phosphate ABC transporter substrate-binding protein PstS [Solirubrobacterales bacterium]|nr:phosphate ABC transporter substrate-binding protein PstS [Solirubrobacterales bacterium]